MSDLDWTEACCALATYALLIALGWALVTHNLWPVVAACIPAGLALMANVFLDGGVE